MSYQHNVENFLEKIKVQGQIESDRISDILHSQHYRFAHRVIPHIIENQFDELIDCLSQNNMQDWIFQIWQDLADDSLEYYSSCVSPSCDFVKVQENIGVIYFTMPSPREIPEALYSAVVFLIDDELTSKWLRGYFTLELGMESWVLGKWEDYTHCNL